MTDNPVRERVLDLLEQAKTEKHTQTLQIRVTASFVQALNLHVASGEGSQFRMDWCRYVLKKAILRDW